MGGVVVTCGTVTVVVNVLVRGLVVVLVAPDSEVGAQALRATTGATSTAPTTVAGLTMGSAYPSLRASNAMLRRCRCADQDRPASRRMHHGNVGV
jgi:hypothetical protein